MKRADKKMETIERSLEERTDRARQCLSPAKVEKFKQNINH